MIKYLLIALGAIVFCMMLVADGLGVVAYLKLRSLPVSTADTGVTSRAKGPPKAPKKPTATNAVFVEIPQFVVSIPSPADATNASPAATYLQLSLSFLTEDKRAAADFGKLIPIIKSGIISDVMSLNMSPNIQPVKMKRRITEDSLQIVNTIVSQSDGAQGKAPFQGAYITSFITQ